MNESPWFRIATALDAGQPIDVESFLTPGERRQYDLLPTERRRRHFLIGRQAARQAIRVLLGPESQDRCVDIVNRHETAPYVSIDGRTDLVAVSISHSGRLAVACAWFSSARCLVSAGVDVEYVKPNEVAESRYAFSDRERVLLARLPQGPEIAGLAGWTVKEAVWKALLASQAIGPDSIDICALSLNRGGARVHVGGKLAQQLGGARLDVLTGIVEQCGDRYIVSLAQVIDSHSVSMDERYDLPITWTGQFLETPA